MIGKSSLGIRADFFRGDHPGFVCGFVAFGLDTVKSFHMGDEHAELRFQFVGQSVRNIYDRWISLQLCSWFGAAEHFAFGVTIRANQRTGDRAQLGIIIFLVWSLLGKRESRGKNEKDSLPEEIKSREIGSERQSTGFILLMILLGAGLTILPEFVYLKDQFGWPINTYFKFYFEAWFFGGWLLQLQLTSFLLN